MNDMNAAATAEYKNIHISQIADTLSSPAMTGKFYSFDESMNDTPWVGINKADPRETKVEKFATKSALFVWLAGDGDIVSPANGSRQNVEDPAMAWLYDEPSKPVALSYPPAIGRIESPIHIPEIQSAAPLAVDGIPAEYAERVDSLLKINPIDADQEKLIRKNFAHYFRDLAKLTAESRAIVVTDRTDKDGMAAAKAKRIQFKNIRVSAEKVRKALKEESIRYGRVVDGSYKLIGEPCEAEEEYLQAQEDFEKNLIAAERERVIAERSAELAPYVEETRNFNLGDMSDEQFGLLLIGSRTTHEQKIKFLAEQDELDRLDKERQNRKIERLNVLSAIGLSFDGFQYAYGDIGITETAVDTLEDDEFDAKVDGINQLVIARKAEREAEIEKDRVERDRLQKIADDQAKVTADAAAEAERIRLAPDKDKLLVFAERIRALTLDMPEVDVKFDTLLNQVEDRIQGIVTLIKTAAESN